MSVHPPSRKLRLVGGKRSQETCLRIHWDSLEGAKEKHLFFFLQARLAAGMVVCCNHSVMKNNIIEALLMTQKQKQQQKQHFLSTTITKNMSSVYEFLSGTKSMSCTVHFKELLGRSKTKYFLSCDIKNSLSKIMAKYKNLLPSIPLKEWSTNILQI